jgi:hypothetical protein
MNSLLQCLSLGLNQNEFYNLTQAQVFSQDGSVPHAPKRVHNLNANEKKVRGFTFFILVLTVPENASLCIIFLRVAAIPVKQFVRFKTWIISTLYAYHPRL